MAEDEERVWVRVLPKLLAPASSAATCHIGTVVCPPNSQFGAGHRGSPRAARATARMATLVPNFDAHSVGRGNARWMIISARPSADLPFTVRRPGADAQLDASVAEEVEHSLYIGL